MPYVLVHKLNELSNMRFKVRPSPDGIIDLTDPKLQLPEEVLDAIDDIVETARKVFGSTIKPDIRKGNIMAEQGYPVEPGLLSAGVWRTGIINTPKGQITYR